jgi:hypothetical protein
MRNFIRWSKSLQKTQGEVANKSLHHSLREKNMKITKRKPVQKAEDLLTTVARSIGSTLGVVAAKVNATTHPSRRRRPAGRTRTRKHGSISRTSRASASVSKRSNKAARLTTKNRKKSPK